MVISPSGGDILAHVCNDNYSEEHKRKYKL